MALLPVAGSGFSVHGVMRKEDSSCDAKRDGGRLGPAQMVRCEKRKKPPTAATLSAATSTTPKRHDTPQHREQHRTSFSGCASSHRSKPAVRGLSTASATAVAPFCPRAPLESSGWADTGCFSILALLCSFSSRNSFRSNRTDARIRKIRLLHQLLQPEEGATLVIKVRKGEKVRGIRPHNKAARLTTSGHTRKEYSRRSTAGSARALQGGRRTRLEGIFSSTRTRIGLWNTMETCGRNLL